MDESKGKKWYEDSGGKVSPKRVIGTIGFILILLAWIIAGFEMYSLPDKQVDQIPIILGILGAMMAAGGFTKGG